MGSESEFLAGKVPSKNAPEGYATATQPSTHAPPYEQELPTYQAATNGPEPRTFEITTSAFLGSVTISGPEAYHVDVGFGPNGAMKLQRESSKGEVLGVAHFSRKPAAIRLCAEDPKTTSNQSWVQVPDARPREDLPLPVAGRDLHFRCDGWLTVHPFRLVDDEKRVVLAEFQPGKARHHSLTLYDVSPDIERYVLLLASVIAVRVGTSLSAPPLYSSYWKTHPNPYGFNNAGAFGLLGAGI